MQLKFIRFFLCLAGVLLLVMALAKLISSFGSARILQNLDPILAISFQHLLWIAGTFELVVALVCFFGKWLELQASLVALLATSFLIYYIGLWVGYNKPCSCLGNLTDALHIPPQTADTAMKIILGYLLVESYTTLFWLWELKSKKTPSA